MKTVVFAALNSSWYQSNPVFYYLRQMIRDLDYEVKMLALNVNDLPMDTLNTLHESGADVLCFSAYIWNRVYLQALLPDLRALLPNTLIVVGGPEAADGFITQFLGRNSDMVEAREAFIFGRGQHDDAGSAIALDPSIRDWIESRFHHVGKYPLSGMFLRGTREALDQLDKDEVLQEQLQVLSDALAEQNKCRCQLQEKMEGIAASCTTRKQLLEALPEFEQYLPAETAARSRSVPALANLLADLTAAGWPKQGKASGSDAAADAPSQEGLDSTNAGLLVCAHEHEEVAA